MVAATRNLKIERNATYRKSYQLFVKDQQIDLSGFTAKMQIRETPQSDTILLELSTQNGKLSLDTSLGIITLKLEVDDISTVLVSAASYDLVLTSASNISTRLLMGRVIFVDGVTRG